MKTKIFSVLMVLVFLVALGLVAAAPTTAGELDETGNTVPDDGNVTVGQAVVITEVDGGYFLPGAPLTFLWGPNIYGNITLDIWYASPIATIPAPVIANPLTVPPAGALPGATIVVPAIPAGNYSVYVADGVNTPLRNNMMVIPDLVLSPSSAPIGATVTAIGTGFAAEVDVTIKQETLQIASAATDAAGSFITTFTMAADMTGIVTAMDLSVAANSASATMSLEAGVSAEAIQEIIDSVKSLELPNGVENPLTSKLENAIKALASDNVDQVEKNLEAFVKQVETRAGTKLPDEQADMLIEEAMALIEGL